MTRYLDRIGEGSVIEFLEMESNETIKQAAMAGLGVAFLSLHTVTEEVATGRLVRLNAPGLPITRQWYLVQPSGKDTRAVVDLCRRHILDLRGAYFPVIDSA
jgi:DNA-binding transcriptional LysR family regulator